MSPYPCFSEAFSGKATAVVHLPRSVKTTINSLGDQAGLGQNNLFLLPLVPCLGFILISLERKERGTELKIHRQKDRQRDRDRGGTFIFKI